MKKIIAILLLVFAALAMTTLCMAQDSVSSERGEVRELILGEDTSWLQFAVYWMFGMLGFVGSLLMDVYSSGEGMKDFSFRFWYKDNKVRVFISMFFITLFIIFSKELIELNVSNWSSLIIGFTIDKIMENFKQRKRNIVKKTEI